MFVPSLTPLVTESQIEKRINELAQQIVARYGEDEPITLIGLLRGCFVFLADLARAISRQGGVIDEIDFLIASSYGGEMTSTRNVKIERDVRHDIAGRSVLLVDDILDTGHTLTYVLRLMRMRAPKQLCVAVLLDKPSRREMNVNADFVGFSIEDSFVVGYGLDYDQRYRELPYITTMIERG